MRMTLYGVSRPQWANNYPADTTLEQCYYDILTTLHMVILRSQWQHCIMCPLGTHENMDKSLQFLSFMVLLYEGSTLSTFYWPKNRPEFFQNIACHFSFWHQSIIWTGFGLFIIGTSGANFDKNWKKKKIHTLKLIYNCHDFCQHIMKILINITQGKGWAIIGSLVFWYIHHKLHILTSSYICILLAKLLFSIALVAFQFMASLCCESRSPCTWAGGLLSKIHIKCHVN